MIFSKKYFRILFIITFFSNFALAQFGKICLIDSLQGFDEQDFRALIISENFTRDEINFRMKVLKRQYINQKFNLLKNSTLINQDNTALVQKASSSNLYMDFESSPAGTITASNQILGWTLESGTNNGLTNGVYWNNCNMLGCCPSSPSESAIFSAPNGYVDSIIGQCYPIYSVFGSSINPSGNKGSNFIRLNSSLNNFGKEKLWTYIFVDSSIGFFNFSYLFVNNGGAHFCCDAPSFQLEILQTSNSSPIACSNYSISSGNNNCSTPQSPIFLLLKIVLQ